ncbi:MAG TPA: PfkB family carbohydrate kinase, partial [Candidatus Bathyarchaeia archaeon]|nr:PfkB family carbohydrate kinase [Candidatus Bathyarchaeia archaeon]
ALMRLGELGSALPIVTLADRGSVLLNEEELCRVPAFPTNAMDPTGAGDVYAGSFITEFQRSNNITESALFASAAASIMVEQVGPDFSMTRTVVEERRETIRERLTKQSVRS